MSAPAAEHNAIYTIGHSNRSAAALISMLKAHGIRLLVDIRAFPRSRRFPHFNRAVLEDALPSREIAYYWRGDMLGGFRKPRRDSPHSALTDAAFRGFADYMDTEAFLNAVDTVLARGKGRRLALMCAEADFHHCHRQFIADHLQRRGLVVNHIVDAATCIPHAVHPCLQLEGGNAVYNRHEQRDLFNDA